MGHPVYDSVVQKMYAGLATARSQIQINPEPVTFLIIHTFESPILYIRARQQGGRGGAPRIRKKCLNLRQDKTRQQDDNGGRKTWVHQPPLFTIDSGRVKRYHVLFLICIRTSQKPQPLPGIYNK